MIWEVWAKNDCSSNNPKANNRISDMDNQLIFYVDFQVKSMENTWNSSRAWKKWFFPSIRIFQKFPIIYDFLFPFLPFPFFSTFFPSFSSFLLFFFPSFLLFFFLFSLKNQEIFGEPSTRQKFPGNAVTPLPHFFQAR